MTIEEFIGAADYLKVYGAKEIILCERGIKTFETATRNTLDFAAVPIIFSLNFGFFLNFHRLLFFLSSIYTL